SSRTRSIRVCGASACVADWGRNVHFFLSQGAEVRILCGFLRGRRDATDHRNFLSQSPDTRPGSEELAYRLHDAPELDLDDLGKHFFARDRPETRRRARRRRGRFCCSASMLGPSNALRAHTQRRCGGKMITTPLLREDEHLEHLRKCSTTTICSEP